MNKDYLTYSVSINFSDCHIEREEHDTLADIYKSLLRMPRILDTTTGYFDDAEINIYLQENDELVGHKRAGHLYANFLTELNFTIAEEMGVKL
jgi:hypothetical protein